MPQPTLDTLGRYKILDMLGRGAMGVVYKAIDPAIDRVVAIKTINLTLSDDELAEYEARFAQEVKAAGRLNHPNIVSIYDVGKTEDFAWMAMEFVDGHELKALLRGQKALPLNDGLDIIQQVAEGLAFAHGKDVVHRDIKPSNIMITEDEDHAIAKVTDFGIARMSSSSVKTMTGIVLGSPRYMSPEQVLGKKVGPASDIFSLGVVLFETLTGSAPFDSPSINSIMYQTVHEPCPQASALNGELAPELDRIVAKAMAKLPEERFASMREFARAIRDARQMLLEPASPARASLLKTLGPVPTPVRPLANLLDGLTPSAPLDPAEITRMAPRIDSPVSAVPAPNPVAQAAEATDPRATTRRMSRDFDSTSATRKLAALTEQIREVENLLVEDTPPPAAPSPVASTPTAESGEKARKGIELDPTRAYPRPERPFPISAALLLGTLAALNLGLFVALLL
jgi:serine/threonine-protein kinase